VDDLSAPLGQKRPQRAAARWLGKLGLNRIPVTPIQALAGGLGLAVGAVALWAVAVDDPLGGEPMVVVAAKTGGANAADPAGATDTKGNARRYDGPPPTAAQPSGAQTVNIIDGASGKSQQVVIPVNPAGPGSSSNTASAPPGDQHLLEKTRHGDVPRIGADGARPSTAYARPLAIPPGKADAPRIALVVTGLGISTKATNDALTRLPGPVSFAFTPYGHEVDQLVGRARQAGHEVLLQAPMEPFDYPDNDPGPQTLLTSLTAEQNIDRMQWLMSRFQGYVGIANFMGARFTASESALGPILRETGKRGLIFVDDGTSSRSLAGQIAGANNIPFAKADVVIDNVPTAAEIDRALGRLEAQARERGIAFGVLTALPLAITRVADWTKKAEARGFVLVPITAVAIKAKSS